MSYPYLQTVDPMTNTTISPFVWWEARRLQYNAGLLVAGIIAFFAYVLLGSWLLSDDPNFEITLFTISFQGIGYLFMMGLANICYFLGPISERFVHPAQPLGYRCACFRLGFWFSVSLPFAVPALVIISAMAGPHRAR